MKKFLISTLMATLLVSLLLPLSAVMAQPAPPQLFYGIVTLDGSPAPDGTSVTAEMAPYGQVASTTTPAAGGPGSYAMEVPGQYADEGKTILFYVNGLSAGSAIFDAGEPTPLDLSATSPPQYTLTITTTGDGNTTGAAGPHDGGTVVPITATPDAGWQFVNWTGDIGTIANPNSANTTITMNGNYTITANFLPTRTLTMAVTGNGSTNPAVGDHPYADGTVVNITAIPDSGWQFDSWTGDAFDANSASTTVFMDADKTATAIFVEAPPVTLTMAVTGNGSTTPEVGTHEYPQGTVVDITATPDPGHEFAGWSGDVADANSATTTVTMNTDKTVTANFVPEGEVALTVQVSGSGTTIPEEGTHSYPKNTVVEISATADSGWEFTGWDGDVADSGSATTTVTMDENKTITANFSELPPLPTSTLTMAVTGNGSTTPEVGTHEYPQGTVVDITATADSGYEFTGWSGDVADANSATTTVTMDADKTVTANFSLVSDSTPPTNSNIQATNATRTSVEISWTTDEPSTSQVDYSASPGELSPLDATLVTAHMVRLTGLNPATTYSYKVMSRDAAGNLSVSEELTFTTLATPATFITSDWSIAITEVDSGQEVTITFTITNTGEQAGTYEVALAVNGAAESTEELSLEPGASEKITFVTTKGATGTYTVTVDGLSFSFEVPEEATPIEPPPSGGVPGWLVILLALIIVLLVAALVITVLADRGRLGSFRWPLLAPRGVPGQYYDEAMIRSRIEAAAEEKDRLRTTAYAEETPGFEGEVDEDEEKKLTAADKAREQWAKMEAESEARRAEAEKKSREIKGEAAEAEVGVEKVPPVEPADAKVAGVLTVTALASKKLKEAVQAKTTDPTMGFRLTRSPDKPSQLKMTLDKATPEDQVVKSEGVIILLINPKLIPTLEGMVIDYSETPQGGSLSITRRSPGR